MIYDYIIFYGSKSASVGILFVFLCLLLKRRKWWIWTGISSSVLLVSVEVASITIANDIIFTNITPGETIYIFMSLRAIKFIGNILLVLSIGWFAREYLKSQPVVSDVRQD